MNKQIMKDEMNKSKITASVINKVVGLTDVTLRDAHQSILATRVRTDDLLSLCEYIDQTNYWSAEVWGGATYDACMRFLGEDPWDRLRQMKKSMPNTRLQMLLRGKNLLGYRHQDISVIARFVELSRTNGIDVFRVFDAVNSIESMKVPLEFVKKFDGHAQGTLSYTTSPVHDLQYWLDTAKKLEDLSVDSIAIKDMAGLLAPYAAFELVSALKQTVAVPIHMQCHATTGFAIGSYIKAVEAGIDNVDTAISTWSLTYGHPPVETICATLAQGERSTQCNTAMMKPVADICRNLRSLYSEFEGSLQGIDARIINAQVPGGMLSNLENQLREQNAQDKFDLVMEEIPKVRQDLGYIPLVTPTSQIVGSQAVVNVLRGKRYDVMTAEVASLLRGEYGKTPAPVNAALIDQANEQKSQPALTLAQGTAELEKISAEKQFAMPTDEHIISFIMLPQAALKFLQHQGDPTAFEPAPLKVDAKSSSQYEVSVDGRLFRVDVNKAGDVTAMTHASSANQAMPATANAAVKGDLKNVATSLAGTIISIDVAMGEKIEVDQKIATIEALKMEIEIFSDKAGIVAKIDSSAGQSLQSGDTILTLSS